MNLEEKIVEFDIFEENTNNHTKSSNTTEKRQSTNKRKDNQTANKPAKDKNAPYKTRYGRTSRQTKHMYNHLSFLSAQELNGSDSKKSPKDIQEALDGKDKEKWLDSIYSELMSIAMHKSF